MAIRDYRTYFEYVAELIKNGLKISPIKLPLISGLQTIAYQPFERLPGFFSDTLPDGWGRLLFDRYIRSQNLLPDDFSSLDRLGHVGTTGPRALVNEPDHGKSETEEKKIDLDILFRYTQDILVGEANGVLEEHIDLNGSSAGARPKPLLVWIKRKPILFPGSMPLGRAMSIGW